MQKSARGTIFIFIALFITISCSKKSDPAPAPVNPQTSTSKYYFRGAFDNKSYIQETYRNGYSNGVGSSSNGHYTDPNNTDDYVYDFWEGSFWSKTGIKQGQFYDSTGLSMRIYSQISYVGYDTPDQNKVNEIFAAKTYSNFSGACTNGNYPASQGWDIELIDGSGKVWTSYAGSASQTNSFVKIESQQKDRVNGQIFLVLKGSVTCNLYDEDGNIKVLTGSFNQLFSNYMN